MNLNPRNSTETYLVNRSILRKEVKLQEYPKIKQTGSLSVSGMSTQLKWASGCGKRYGVGTVQTQLKLNAWRKWSGGYTSVDSSLRHLLSHLPRNIQAQD